MTKIESLNKDPKSKNFVKHLLHSYLPISKIKNVNNFMYENKPHNCSVCNTPLISVNKLLINLSNVKAGTIPIHNNMWFLDKIQKGEHIEVSNSNPLAIIFENSKLGYVGEKTNTHLCLPCIEELFLMQNNRRKIIPQKFKQKTRSNILNAK